VYFRETTWWDNSEVIGGGKGKRIKRKGARDIGREKVTTSNG